MLSKALADIIWNGSKPPPAPQTVLDFIGEPLVAMTLAVLLAMVTFGYAVGLDGQKVASRIGASVGPVAAVILIVGAGGGFKQTLIGAGVGDSVAKFASGTHLSILVLGLPGGRCLAPSHRIGHGGDHYRGRDRRAAGGQPDPDPRRSAGARHRRGLPVSLARERRRLLAGQGVVRLTVGETFKSWSVMETAVSLLAFAFIMVLSVLM